jgi:hypothetical protein
MNGNFLENDDMTENSDSGFTEINQTGSSDISQHAKSKTASPEPELMQIIQHGESSSEPLESKVLDNNSEPASNLGSSKSSGSSNSSSDDDDSDSDDDDYDGSRPSVLNWVSFHLLFHSFRILIAMYHIEGSPANVKRG